MVVYFGLLYERKFDGKVMIEMFLARKPKYFL